ncbi:MAG TPA: hypothetical protein VFB66_01325, partial [Tepidisphaeraceae bacterium]|nr:hypothetical protein [Tepidisphaeraceae bacterium]
MATSNPAKPIARASVRRQNRWQLEPLEPRTLLSIPAATGVSPPPVEVLGGVQPAGGNDVPVLNSQPGTLRTLYLDFDGDSTEEWSDEEPGLTPRYDEDGDPTSFSDTELEGIREIWARVAEKYSPFRLNVTTFYPGPLVFGVQGRVVIGGQGMWHDNGTTGGTALPNGFFDDDLSNTGWVFSKALSGRKAVAEAIAHEAGHLLNLHHQSQYFLGAVQSAEYHPGDADRAPIMGNSYSATRGLWWIGHTGFLPVDQNDLEILEDKLGYRADDHSDARASATPLTPAGVGVLAGSGVITTQSFADGFDLDYFSFTTTGGDATFTVSPAQFGGMLDATASIRTTSGLLIARSDTSALAETVSASDLAPGTYLLLVEGGGNYNDIGQYTVAGVLDESHDNTMPTAIRVGGDLIERPFTGWRSYNNFVGPNDADDFYRFVTGDAPSVFTAHLYGLAADATLRLIRDYDNNGLIGAGETLATSAQGGTADELIANVPLAAGTVYYVRVSRVSGQTNYALNLFTDYARNSLGPARPTGTPAGWTGRGAVPAGPLCGEFVATDFVDGGDRDDFYRVRLDAAAVLDVALTGMTGDADLSLVHDADGDGTVDLGEVVESSANAGTAAEAIS